jgi:hypothetical protein
VQGGQVFGCWEVRFWEPHPMPTQQAVPRTVPLFVVVPHACTLHSWTVLEPNGPLAHTLTQERRVSLWRVGRVELELLDTPGPSVYWASKCLVRARVPAATS